MSDRANMPGADPSLPITPQRLLDAYAISLKRYLAAERALKDAVEPTFELVYEHDTAAEDFRTIRGIFRASAKRSQAIHNVESWRESPQSPDPEVSA